MFLIIKYIQIVGCISYTKGTTLKANHNNNIVKLIKITLYFIYQRYDFESKSQLYGAQLDMNEGCISYTKGTTLKANHNNENFIHCKSSVVFHIPKVRL